ncbi:hypothetical protein V495_00903 [Pseudogymnoascus sp. VKM F-4514 (FW-929)]|nr:hypothetical protein V495_00903 [Pseudogymnoascus sp. VKM F-4514 (FW-929)]KFY55537.1 hypothetical protein V497_06886 [Pseudogymnoascus sp. VKM F-4516 (FW-969)]
MAQINEGQGSPNSMATFFSPALEEYRIQRMVVEQHHQRILLLVQERAGEVAAHTVSGSESYALQDYRMQLKEFELMLQEEQKKTSKLLDLEIAGEGGYRTVPGFEPYAFQDYVMQLMLLEQQNKRRLLMTSEVMAAMNEMSVAERPVWIQAPNGDRPDVE